MKKQESKVEEARADVWRQRFTAKVECPICGYRSNGRILMGNFTGKRDTRVNAVIRHINREHA